MSAKGATEFVWEGAPWTMENAFARIALLDLGPEDDSPHPVTLLIDYHPNVEIPPHYHDCDYVSLVLAGSIEVTRRSHGPGEFRFVKAGTAYGPLRVGPDGCRVVEFFGDVLGTFPRYLKVDPAQAAALEEAEALGREFLRTRGRAGAPGQPR